MPGLPQAEVELVLIAGRSWTRTFSQRELDQTTLKPLDGFTSGFASFKARVTDAEPLITFAVEIDHDEESPSYNKAHAVATRQASAGIVRETVGVFDCVLLHSDGETTLEICPPVKMIVKIAPTTLED